MTLLLKASHYAASIFSSQPLPPTSGLLSTYGNRPHVMDLARAIRKHKYDVNNVCKRPYGVLIMAHLGADQQRLLGGPLFGTILLTRYIHLKPDPSRESSSCLVKSLQTQHPTPQAQVLCQAPLGWQINADQHQSYWASGKASCCVRLSL